MNWTAIKWAIEVVSLLAALASALDAGLAVEIKVNGPAKLRAGDRLEFTFIVSGTDDTVHFAPKLRPLDDGAKSAIADRKVVEYTEKNRSAGKFYCYEGLYAFDVTVTTETDDATASITIDVPRGGADCPPCPKPEPDNPPGPTPIPPPNPTPPMPPAPTVPIGEFNIAPKIAAFVSKLHDPDKAATAEKLRADLEGISQQIKDGTITGVAGLTTAIGKALKDTGKPQWIAASADVTKVISEAYEIHKSGSLALTNLYGFKGPVKDANGNPQGYALLMHEAAVGVEFGAKSK